MRNSGTHSPSLSPLSTFKPCLIRDGTRWSVTTAWPSAASVQASMIASTSASTRLTPGSTATPAAAPAAIVSGRPRPSSRSGTAYSRRRARTEIREASANSTRVRVISATSFTSSLPTERSSRPSTGPASRPAAVKNIAAVTLSPSSRRDRPRNRSTGTRSSPAPRSCPCRPSPETGTSLARSTVDGRLPRHRRGGRRSLTGRRGITRIPHGPNSLLAPRSGSESIGAAAD